MQRRLIGTLSGAVALMALMALPAPTRAELIVNGGFELPNIGTLPFTAPIGVGSSAIPGWEVVSGNVEIVSRAFSAPIEGNQWLDLNGLMPGAIQQTFATMPGETYLLSFAYANNPFAVFANARVDVLGALMAPVLTADVTGIGSTFATPNYQIFSGTFTANSATTTVRFTATGSTDIFSGLALDAVSVSTVPEPSTSTLLGVGALGLIGYAWRRCRSNPAAHAVRQQR